MPEPYQLPSGTPELMTPAEVAQLFRVGPKTVTRWAAAGRIGSVRTPGGHRLYRRDDVQAVLDTQTSPRTEGVG
ncbi:excisionase family DNA binding protein [Nonomuraea thailandensis]|uniref:Excisionase family DNA binding protein n=1 Tax=Nonomuraea thailandensis TaxID=1188745 RepID=A0A9X2GUW3_9ACTN|nr:BldC family transcriptional regulator [Nonomuraea thailandensis]MCP2364249.1 excisionase family DNA binding protein [Nonomuraea thailandensis]